MEPNSVASRRIRAGGLAIILLSSLIFSVVGFMPSVEAADTHTWDGGGGDVFAGTSANWDTNVHPEIGDAVIFNAGSLPCTWNLSLALGTFSITAGYSGVITQGTSFSVTSYSQAGGTVTGSASYTLTCNGNWIQTGGLISDSTLRVIMNSNGASFTVFSGTFLDIQISESCTVTKAGSWFRVARNIIVDTGKTLTIAPTTTLYWHTWTAGASLSNSGIIAGTTGIFESVFYNTNKAITFGTVTCPVLIDLSAGATGSFSCILNTGTTFDSTLTISSSHATNTMTLDLSSSNYALSAIGITIGTRGILNGRGSQITDSGIWNSQNGTFTRGTSSVHLTGVSRNLWMEAGGMFNNMLLDSGASYTLRTNAKTYNYWKNGTLTSGVYTLTVNNNQGPVFWNTPVEIASEGTRYTYQANTTDREANPITYALTTDAPFLSEIDEFGYFYGTPEIGDNGIYHVYVAASDGNDTTWQNFTLDVDGFSATNFTPVLSIALIFCFGIMAVGFKMHELWLLAGPVWIFCAIAIFNEYHEAFMVMGAGLGIVLLMRGAYEVYK